MRNSNYLILILSICILSLTKGKAQRTWAGELSSFAGPYPYFIEECADTTINDTTWTKFIQRSKYSDTVIQTEPILITEIHKKVFARQNMILPSRILLYDYSLETNDTFYFYLGTYERKFVVIQADSINVLGTLRKRIKLRHESGTYEDEWVQGIGSLRNNYFNPCEPENHPKIGSRLSCFKNDPGSATYFVLDTQFCLIENFQLLCDNTSDTDQAQIDKETIAFPNPSHGTLNIHHFETIDRWTIYSIDGSVMAEATSNQSELDLSDDVYGLTAGVYFVTIQSSTSLETISFVRL